MNANEYQVKAARTMDGDCSNDFDDLEISLIWNSLGLVGEAGEIAEHIKKGILHKHGIDKGELKRELGDVLWYLSALCTRLDFSLADVMQTNIDKLLTRYPDGFSYEDSHRRIDQQDA